MSDTYYLRPQQRNKSKGSKAWYGGVVENGITKWVSLKTANKKVADEWFNRMQVNRYSPEQQDAKPVSLEQASEAFLLDVENVRKRVAGTVKLYTSYLKEFKAWCKSQGIADMRGVTPTACSEFAQTAFAKNAANTAKTKVIMFRHFYNWASEQYGINAKNPFKKIVVAKSKSAPREFWTIEECEKIIAAASNPEYKCWFALMAFAGLRREEARHLMMENIDGCKISLIGKGNKAATLPISSRLKKYLNEYLTLRGDAPGYLFLTLAKQQKVKDTVIKNAVIKSGLESKGKAHYHRFRHSFASNLMRLGRNIKAVQMLMRHEDVSLTLNIYGHLLPSDLAEAVEL